MEASLQWKQEPASPLQYEEVLLLDDTFYHTPLHDALDDVKLEDHAFDTLESQAEVASQILENLENLMDLDDLIKDEPFLLDEKMLPLLDDVHSPCGAVAVPVNFKSERYYDTLAYDIVELSANTTAALTPPQSPPREHPMLTNLDMLATQQQQRQAMFLQQQRPDLGKTAIYSVPEKQFTPTVHSTASLINIYSSLPTHSGSAHIEELNQCASSESFEYAAMPTPQHDVAHELAVVDELVRTRVENMQWTSSGPSSPDSSSSNSNFGDCSSSDDPEWAPESTEHYKNSPSSQPGKILQKKRSKLPKNPEDKKSRKKEQNKNAATRYRLKKKAEVEEILSEEKSILNVNNELNTKIVDLQREIRYLKGLMRDVLKAKAIIN